MTTHTLSIDGLAAASTPKREEVVLFDRARHQVEKQNTTKSINSLQPVKVSAQTDSKLRATKAKQRGWEVVAQARQDSKHRDRHNQRHAAKTAAHHHRQRHDMDNYARAHTSTLELDEVMNDMKPTQPKVSLRLHISNLMQSHSMKLASFGMAILAIVGGAALFTAPAAQQPVAPQSGQVQAITTSSVNQPNTQTQPATLDETSTTTESTQVATDDDDGNLQLWSSTLEQN